MYTSSPLLPPPLLLLLLACFLFSEFGDVVATSESLEVEDAVAFDDSVAAIRRHLEDGTSNETIFEVSQSNRVLCLWYWYVCSVCGICGWELCVYVGECGVLLYRR